MKGNSFSVKDLLDLPAEGKAVTSPPNTDGSLDLSAPRVGPTDLAVVTGQFYDATDNPYTRWLQTNEHMQYGRKSEKFISILFVYIFFYLESRPDKL